jgi:hypothetical protein
MTGSGPTSQAESKPNAGLTVVEQREVTFYDDELTAVLAADGQVYVSIRNMCHALGLNTQAQTRRIRRQPILDDGYEGVAIMATPGGQQRGAVLRVDLVPLWLSGIDTKRVKEAIRPKLERYQREAAKVLWEAFREGRLTTEPLFDELLAQDTPEAQAYKMIQGMLQLARNQLMMRSQLQDHAQRLEQIEATLGDPGRAVTPDQASQISQAVKAVAMLLSKRSGSNQYGSVYGELYRKFGITSYKLLPADKFEKASNWLTEWYQTLDTDPHEPPF